MRQDHALMVPVHVITARESNALALKSARRNMDRIVIL